MKKFGKFLLGLFSAIGVLVVLACLVGATAVMLVGPDNLPFQIVSKNSVSDWKSKAEDAGKVPELEKEANKVPELEADKKKLENALRETNEKLDGEEIKAIKSKVANIPKKAADSIGNETKEVQKDIDGWVDGLKQPITEVLANLDPATTNGDKTIEATTEVTTKKAP